MRPFSQGLKVTLRHLAAARFYLPVNPVQSPENGMVSQLEEFLHQTELALAMEELEGLGQANGVGEEFWTELVLAAENMGLHEQATRYRAKLAGSASEGSGAV